MSRNQDIERKTVAVGEGVGQALENFARTITDRVIALLDKERADWLKRDADILGAVTAIAQELTEMRQESKAQRTELLALTHGMDVQLAEQLSGHGSRLDDHEARLKAIEAWIDERRT